MSVCLCAGHDRESCRNSSTDQDAVWRGRQTRVDKKLLLTLPAVYAQQGLWNGQASVWPSICPSVCLFHRSTAAAACGRFAAERPAARDRWPIRRCGVHCVRRGKPLQKWVYSGSAASCQITSGHSLLGRIACTWCIMFYLSVYWTQPWTMQKRLNRSRCCLGYGHGWAQETTYYKGGADLPGERAILEGLAHRALRCDHSSNFFDHLLDRGPNPPLEGACLGTCVGSLPIAKYMNMRCALSAKV